MTSLKHHEPKNGATIEQTAAVLGTDDTKKPLCWPRPRGKIPADSPSSGKQAVQSTGDHDNPPRAASPPTMTRQPGVSYLSRGAVTAVGGAGPAPCLTTSGQLRPHPGSRTNGPITHAGCAPLTPGDDPHVRSPRCRNPGGLVCRVVSSPPVTLFYGAPA